MEMTLGGGAIAKFRQAGEEFLKAFKEARRPPLPPRACCFYCVVTDYTPVLPHMDSNTLH
jgi:hypothetical protein